MNTLNINSFSYWEKQQHNYIFALNFFKTMFVNLKFIVIFLTLVSINLLLGNNLLTEINLQNIYSNSYQGRYGNFYGNYYNPEITLEGIELENEDSFILSKNNILSNHQVSFTMNTSQFLSQHSSGAYHTESHYTVYWGDNQHNTIEVALEWTNPQDLNFSHTYTQAGNYTISVKRKSWNYLGRHCCTETFNFTLIVADFSYQTDVYRNNSYINLNGNNERINDKLIKFNPNNFQTDSIALFVEGFGMEDNSFYDYYLTNDMIQNLSQNNILYFMDVSSSRRDMRYNALSVASAIEKISLDYPNSNVSVYGYSMGGVLGKFALAFLEQENIQHSVIKLVTLDSPLRGAHLNTNLQTILTSASFSGDGYLAQVDALNEKLDELKETLHADAVIQMVRDNIHGTFFNRSPSIIGSQECLYFYSYISPVDRALYEQYYSNNSTPPQLLNSNNHDDYYNPKPGSPYKQNDIQCVTYSLGSLSKSTQNPETLLSLNLRLHLNFIGEGNTATFASAIDIATTGEDRLAGSKFNRLEGEVVESLGYKMLGITIYTGSLGINISENLQSTLIPTFSSLNLQTYDIQGVNTPLDIGCSVLREDTSSIKIYNSSTHEHSEFDLASEITDYNVLKVSGIYKSQGIPLQNIPINLIKSGPSGPNTSYPTVKTTEEGYYESFGFSAQNTLTLSSSVDNDTYGCMCTLDFTDSHEIIKNINTSNINLQNGNTLLVGSVGDIRGFNSVSIAADYIHNYVITNPEDIGKVYKILMCGNYPYLESEIDYSDLPEKVKIEVSTVSNSLVFGGFLKLNNVDLTVKNTQFSYSNVMIPEIINSDLTFDNCTFSESESRSPLIFDFSNSPSNSSNITIDNCSFNENNIGQYLFSFDLGDDQDDYNYIIGALYIDDANSSNSFKIINTEFINNSNPISGAIFARRTGDLLIENCKFISNSLNHNVVTNLQPAGSIYSLDSDIELNKCLFENSNIDFTGTDNIQASIVATDGSVITSTSNSYIESYEYSCIFTTSDSSINSNSDLYYSDLSDTNKAIVSNSNWNSIDNSLIYGFISDEPLTFSVNQENKIYYENPNLDEEYIPIWTENIKSPAIDNGTAHFSSNGYFLRQDDIGAFEHTAQSNQNYRYLPGGQIHWISIPYLNKNDNSWHHVFHDWHENGLLEEQDENSKVKEIYTLGPDIENGFNPDSPYGEYNPDLPLYSQYGFKVDLSNKNGVYLDYHGFDIENSLSPEMKVNTAQGIVNTRNIYIPEKPQNEDDPGYDYNNGNPARRIYLGYYKDYSMSISHAFGPLLQNISVIQSKNWFAVRDINTNAWVTGENYGGKILTLNPGEMIEVLYHGTEDVEFDWGQWISHPPVDPYVHELAKNFKFEEKRSYLPIILNIDLSQYSEIDEPVEVAILVDDVCKGAAVIKEDQVIMNAYILSDIPDIEAGLKEISFELWFPQLKGSEKRKVDYELVNNSSQEITYSSANLSNIGNYLQVNLADSDIPVIPKALALYDNYPNPFNPETTISFDLPSETNVKLEIYNIKGQKVKTLKNGLLQAGNHKLVWDGKNSNSDQVASGLYFYRLVTDKKKLTRKMILMK